MQANCTSITFPNKTILITHHSDTCWQSVHQFNNIAMPKWSVSCRVSTPQTKREPVARSRAATEQAGFPGNNHPGPVSISCVAWMSSGCAPVCILVASWQKAKLFSQDKGGMNDSFLM
jgi:hypothetical protein